MQIETYIGVDWERDNKDRRLTLGYCTFVGRNLVTCRNKKQIVAPQSSVEAISSCWSWNL